MSRPEDIGRRVANVRQIETIVSALRALAIAHGQEAQGRLAAIRAYEATIAGALADALCGAPPPQTGAGRAARPLLIVVGAAQGFSGAYGDRLADAALERGAAAPERGAAADLIVLGLRTVEALRARGAAPVWWCDMPAHAAEAPALASRVADVAFERLGRGADDRVAILHATPEAPDRPAAPRSLAPFDFTRFSGAARRAPLLSLPRPALLSGLVAEYLFAEICEALMLGFAAESEARAAAMARAQQNVRRIGADLDAAYRRARQEQMTTEIVELAARAP